MKYIKSFNEAKGVWDAANHKYIKTDEYRGIKYEQINGLAYQVWIDGKFYMSSNLEKIWDWIDNFLDGKEDTTPDLNIPESYNADKVVCSKCSWSWDLADGGNDPYVCHNRLPSGKICNTDNTPKS